MTTATLAVAACGLVVTGCSSTSATVDTAPSSAAKSTRLDSPEARTALWDPCNIPTAAMQKSNVDLTTETPEYAGMPIGGAKICHWSADNFDFVIYSTTLMPGDLYQNPSFRELRGTTIGTRPVVMFLDDFSADNQRSCNAAFATYQGEIIMSVVTAPSRKPPKEDPCVTLSRIASNLVSALPK
jgi:hypothetical protein